MIRRLLTRWQLRRARLETERRLQALRDCPRCREREAMLERVRAWLQTEMRNQDYSRATLRCCIESLADDHPKRKTEEQ